MGNDYFRFKAFTIRQAHGAMKVTTEACILGAWASSRFPACGTILDIGSGTGLLMLMIAQLQDNEIHGIEFEEHAYQESLGNIHESPWSSRMKVMPGDVRTYNPGIRYDLIVTNPPFYQHDLKRGSAPMDMAMHGTTLTLEELAAAIDRLLSPDGRAVILLPPHRAIDMQELAAIHGLRPEVILTIRHSRSHAPLRQILVICRKSAGEAVEEMLEIRGEDGDYTTACKQLLRPYYLFL